MSMVERFQMKNWQVWPGRNRFCCDGRVMLGPRGDIPANGCVWMMILVPVGCFYGFMGPALYKDTPVLLAVVAIALFWTLVTLIVTGWSDPGVIPRQTIEQAFAEARDCGFVGDISNSPPSLIKRELDGNIIEFRYCSTCHIYKPPRASHCSDCDNCCKEFDHHCPFVGNCVGQRNYGSFMAFLCCVVVLLVSVLISVMLGVTGVASSVSTNLAFIIVIVVFSSCMFCAIGGFSAFHLFLIVTGKTTKEKLKGMSTGGDRTLCCNRPRSILHLRQLVDPSPVDP